VVNIKGDGPLYRCRFEYPGQSVGLRDVDIFPLSHTFFLCSGPSIPRSGCSEPLSPASCCSFVFSSSPHSVRCARAAPSDSLCFDHMTLLEGQRNATRLLASPFALELPFATRRLLSPQHEPPALAGSATGARCFGSHHSDVTHDVHDSSQFGSCRDYTLTGDALTGNRFI